MTRNHDGDPVLAVRAANRSLGIGETDLPGNSFVRPRLAIRDLPELFPHRLLKRRAAIFERHAKFTQLSCEVTLQLILQFSQVLVRPRHDRAMTRFSQDGELGLQGAAIGKFQQAHSLLRRAGQ